MTTKLIRYACLFAVIIVLCAKSSFGDDGKYAVFNYWSDGVYTLRQECLATSMTTHNGKVDERQQDRNMLTWKIEVVSESDDSQIFKMTINRLVIRLQDNDSELLIFDSSNDKSPELALLNAVVDAAKQTPIKAIVKDGKAIQIEGFSEDFWKKAPVPKNDREKLMLTQAQQLFSDFNISQLFQTMTYLDSPGEVAVGEKWSTESVLPLPTGKEETLKWDCELASVKKSGSTTAAIVQGKGKVEFEVDKISGLLVNMDGTVKYDVQAHYPMEIVQRVTCSLNREIKDENDEPLLEAVIVLQKNNLTIDKH